MIIQVDKEGKTAVVQLCDIALKQSGVQNIQGVTQILGSLKDLPADPEAETPDEEEKTD